MIPPGSRKWFQSNGHRDDPGSTEWAMKQTQSHDSGKGTGRNERAATGVGRK